MKKLSIMFASVAMLFGVGLGVSALDKGSEEAAPVQKAEAATNSVTLAGSFNGWNTTADPLTLSGDYWTIEKTLAADVTFKVVVNGSDWVGDGDGVSWCSGMGSEGKGQNFKVLTAGTYRIKAAKTIGDYGDKSYGIVFENVVKYTVTKYEVLNGGSPTSIESEQVDPGTNYPVPASRYKAGYTFDGWYTTSACTTKYTAKSINANTNIYAKYTSGSWSGTVTIDLGNSGWADVAANYAVMFMDKTTYPSEIDAWSTYLTGTAAGTYRISIPYNIGFEPLQMVVVRYNSTYSQSSWNTNKWPGSGSLWGQTDDISFGTYVIVSGLNGSKNAASTYLPVVKGGTDVWTDKASLSSSKVSGTGHVEYYSTTVTLASGERFKTVVPSSMGDIYYGNYSTHESLTSNFSGGGDSDVNVLVGGTYAFYFDSATRSVYITTVAIAAADEWAQYFLANVGCDPTGASEPSGWSSCATEYGKLSGDAKNIIYSATADEDGSYVEKAVARYDAALRSHPNLQKFIVNSSSVARASSASTSLAIINGNSTTTITVIIVTVIALGAVGGFFLIKRKKKLD